MPISLTHLMAVYNTASHHLMECVKSIRNQDYHPIVIVDDGSTNPDTISGLNLIETSIPDVSVQRLHENMGTPTALNVGHAIIDTDYIALMCSSDIAIAGKYKDQIDLLLKFPNIDVLGTSLMAFKDSDTYRNVFFTIKHNEKPKPGDKKGNHYFIVNHGTVIYKNSAVKAAGGYNEKYRRGQDVELWSRMWENKACFRNLEKIYYLWRR